MKKTTHKNFIDVFLQMRNSKAVRAVNAFLVSPWGICALGALTLLAHVLAFEIVLYTLVVLLAVYVSAFGEIYCRFCRCFYFVTCRQVWTITLQYPKPRYFLLETG